MSIARRSLQVVALLCTLLVGTAAMAVIVTQTTWFKEWLRGFIVRQADDYVNGRLSIGRLDGNLFFGVELGDVDITVNGKTVVDIDDVGLDYNALTLLGGDVVLDDIRLTRPVLHLERSGDGWNLTQLIKARTPDPDQPKRRRTIEIGEIGVSDGTLYIEEGAVGTSGVDAPSRIERLDASVGIKSNEDELTVDIAHVSLRAAEPGFGVNAMSGVIRRKPNEIAFDNVSVRTEESSLQVIGTVRNIEGKAPILDLKVTSDKLALNEVAKIVPALRGYALQPAFEVTATGPADRLALDVSVREASLGKADGMLTVDAMRPGGRAAGTATVEHLNVQALAKDAAAGAASRLQSDITGTVRFDLTLPSGTTPMRGTYAVNASDVRIAGYAARNVVGDGRIDGRTIRVNARGDAYGGHATATGVVDARQPLALDLKGHASNVDLRNLPRLINAPRVTSDLAFGYTLTARGQEVSGDVTLDQSTLAGASLAPGTIGTYRFGAGAPQYTARGEVSGADVERIGREFGIAALATERYRGRVNGSFAVDGTGGGRYPLTLDVTGTVVDSELFGATFPRMDVTAKLAGGDAHVRTAGHRDSPAKFHSAALPLRSFCRPPAPFVRA